MKLFIINGPNLNMLGVREPDLYGKESYSALCEMLIEYAKEKDIEIELYQSNHEGDLVDYIQKAYFEYADGIVINPGAYTHTSVAILDAVKSLKIPTVEVHISDVTKRESFRQISYISEACAERIIGHGLKGYLEAVDYLIENYNNK